MHQVLAPTQDAGEGLPDHRAFLVVTSTLASKVLRIQVRECHLSVNRNCREAGFLLYSQGGVGTQGPPHHHLKALGWELSAPGSLGKILTLFPHLGDPAWAQRDQGLPRCSKRLWTIPEGC